jgi:selenide,water dikinase
MERAEDAGVYKLTDELAVIQTVDFFTPIVDDPYQFGQIAVTNSLSDVYAMGGRPLTALNIVCFPHPTMDISVLRDVLRGGLDKMHEAGVILVGGHSVEDPELKYGISVNGVIHPDKVIHNNGARVGDRLILTKPLGTGIISTAIKGDVAGEEDVARIVRSMTTLNRTASELMQAVGVNACTDITGFGLLGHACEMIECTDVGMVIEASAVPVFPGARELAEMGMIPGGLHRNRDFRKDMVDVASSVPQYLNDILFDPQTSGGLLIAVPGEKAQNLLESLHKEGVAEAAIIGEVVASPKGRITVR